MSTERRRATFSRALRLHLESLNLPAAGLSALKDAAFKDPVRRVGHGRSNVTYRMVSHKMRCTVQCESHIEFALANTKEFGPAEYFWDQALKLNIKYKEPEGRARSIDTVVDYVSIEDGKVILTDCKPCKELERVSTRQPDRYVRKDNGKWISPAGERAAARLGFHYEIYTDQDVNAVRMRNYAFLADFIRHPIQGGMAPRVDKVADYVRSKKVLRLSELHAAIPDRDAVHFAVAQSRIFVDLDVHLIERPSVVEVCEDRRLASSIRALRFEPPDIEPTTVTLQIGATVLWNGVPYDVQCAGPDGYSLIGPNNAPAVIAPQVAAHYVRCGAIKAHGVSTASSDMAVRILRTASPSALQIATDRQKLLDRWLAKEAVADRPSDTTLKRWQAKYREAQRTCGYGVLGLLPAFTNRGRGGSRLTEDQERICADVIEQEYLQPTRKSYRAAYVCLVNRLTENGLPQIDYTTLVRRIKRLDPRIAMERRVGRGAAYQLGPKWRDDLARPEARIPREGSRAWEAAYVDHTHMDVDLLSAWSSVKLGPPYITLLRDRYSQMTLAHVISYFPPSAMTVMLLLRECVRRWGRLPDAIILDCAKEFQSSHVEQTLALLGITKLERPPHEPRHGAGIERAFRALFTQLVYHLAGNTQNDKPGDRSRPRHASSDHACWTPSDFHEALVEFLYTVWPDLPNTGVKETARERFERSLAEQGPSTHRYTTYDRAFYILTLPYAPQGKRKVHNGHVKVANATYTCEALRTLAHDAEKVSVRYDPYDRRHAYAFLANEWTELTVVDSVVLDLIEHDIPYLDFELAARARRVGQQYRIVPGTYRRMLSELRGREQALAFRKLSGPGSASPPAANAPDGRPKRHRSDGYPPRPYFPNGLELDGNLPEDLL